MVQVRFLFLYVEEVAAPKLCTFKQSIINSLLKGYIMFNRILLALLLTVPVCKPANARIYNIRALDGSAQKIRVADDEKGNLIISCLLDTIYIPNLNNITEVRLLKHAFLNVIYDSRGGSGLHIQHTVIVCVNNKRLVEALHFTSLFHEEFIDFSKPVDTADMVAVNSTYGVSLMLTGDAAKNYKLNAKIHDKRTPKLSQDDNYSRDNIARLNFDPGENIFYTSKLKLSGHYTIVGTNAKNDADQYLKGKFLIANFGKMTYYYVKGCWFERGYGDELVKYSYR